MMLLFLENNETAQILSALAVLVTACGTIINMILNFLNRKTAKEVSEKVEQGQIANTQALATQTIDLKATARAEAGKVKDALDEKALEVKQETRTAVKNSADEVKAQLAKALEENAALRKQIASKGPPGSNP